VAELAAEGKFHIVDNQEANAIYEASTHQIMHNEALGRIIRNMYGRIQILEKENASQQTKTEKPERSISP
jgi:hypothetical protein